MDMAHEDVTSNLENFKRDNFYYERVIMKLIEEESQ